MRILDAIRLKPPFSLALAGAGGKSSVLFQLRREVLLNMPPQHGGDIQELDSDTVILCATTHFAPERPAQVDWHIPLALDEPLRESEWKDRHGTILFTGSLDSDGRRTMGLDPNQISVIHRYAVDRKAVMLIEADGSRRRPLKAPASYEPVIPDWVDAVIVVAGLSAVGKPLNSDWVFRTERFAELAAISEGEIIRPQHLASVLCHPAGGRQGIPSSAKPILLLNQATTAELLAAAQEIADKCVSCFSAVVIADLPLCSENIHVDLSRSVIAVHEPAAALILAAGGGQRYGKLKQLLMWKGRPLVRHVAEIALQAGLQPVIVVLGCEAERIAPTLQDLDVHLVVNRAWTAGISSSIIEGINALPSHVGSAILMLADQPQISTKLLQSLLETHSKSLPAIVVPIVDGQRGNPVLFDRCTFPALSGLKGDIGGRAIFEKFPIYWLQWSDHTILMDIDTPDDYQSLMDSTSEGAESSAQ